MSKKGGQATSLLDIEFDPREISLRDYMDLYVKTHREKTKKPTALKDWQNSILNNPVFAKYLDDPVITIFDTGLPSETGSILADAQNASGDPSTLQSRIRVIENSGVLAKIKQLGQQNNLDDKVFESLADNVATLKTRGAQATHKVQYNPTLLGDFTEALKAYVKANPQDKPIANAILFNLEISSRNALVRGLQFEDVQKNRVDPKAQALGIGGSEGLFIEPDREGVKDGGPSTEARSPYSSPISKRASTIIQDQADYNRTVKWANSADPNLVFQVMGKDGPRAISIDDVNRVLAQIKIPGLKRNMQTGDENVKLTSSDMRKLGINLMNLVGIPLDKQAMLLSRDVGGVGAHEAYIGAAGAYNQPAVDDINKVSEFNWKLYSQTVEGGEDAVRNEGKVLPVRTFIFNKDQPTDFEFYGEAQAADVPIVQQKPFNVPVVTDESNAKAAGTEVDSLVDDGKPTTVPQFTPEQIAELKAAGVWSDNIARLTDPNYTPSVELTDEGKPVTKKDGPKLKSSAIAAGTGALSLLGFSEMPRTKRIFKEASENLGASEPVAEAIGTGMSLLEISPRGIAPSDLLMDFEYRQAQTEQLKRKALMYGAQKRIDKRKRQESEAAPVQPSNSFLDSSIP